MNHSTEFITLCEKARQQVEEISVNTLSEWLKSQAPGIVIDVREDHEWNKGHIAQAQHIGRGILERDIVQLYPTFDNFFV